MLLRHAHTRTHLLQLFNFSTLFEEGSTLASTFQPVEDTDRNFECTVFLSPFPCNGTGQLNNTAFLIRPQDRFNKSISFLCGPEHKNESIILRIDAGWP